MVIYRDGQRIQLTRQELLDTYNEVQMLIDENYISKDLISMYRGEEGFNAHMADDLIGDKELRRLVALRYRKRLRESYGTDIEYKCLKEAYAYIKTVANN